MKKFFVAALALICSSSAFALDNEVEEGLSTQVFVGMTASKITDLSLANKELDGKVGAKVGIKFDYVLPNAYGTYMSAGLDWAMKGCQATYEGAIPYNGTKYDAKTKITTHYVELPVHIGYRYNILSNLGVYAEVGPYFALGLTGKSKYTIDADGSWAREFENASADYDYAIFKNKDSRPNFQRWDAGIGVLIGCEYDNRYSLNFAFNWGLTDMWRDSYRDKIYDTTHYSLSKIKNFDFDITFGYRF